MKLFGSINGNEGIVTIRPCLFSGWSDTLQLENAKYYQQRLLLAFLLPLDLQSAG